MPASPLSMHESWHFPPYVPLLPQRKIPPVTPPPVATDTPPFPGLHLQLLQLLETIWYAQTAVEQSTLAQSKSLQRSFFNPQWSVPDNPPLLADNTPQMMSRLQIVVQNYYESLALHDATLYNLISGSARGRRRSSSTALLPPTDPPPPYVLKKRLAVISDAWSQFTSQLLYNNLPPQGIHQGTFQFAPPIVVIDSGLIAFQPNAFQIGYPRRKISFQGMNRRVGIKLVQVKPFIRLVSVVTRNRMLEEHKPGDAVVIGVFCFDPTSSPEVLFTPASVKVTLFNPDKTVRLDNAGLTPVSTGFLSYVHQTSTSDPPGVYTGSFTASNFGSTGISLRQDLFKLVND